MIESIKEKIWDLLKEKEVSLAMIYNRQGEILWHRGRSIQGKDVSEGDGFSKTYIKQSLDEHRAVDKENVLLSSEDSVMPKSALFFHIKSILILPVSEEYFLYVDSGNKRRFSDDDRAAIKVIGNMLAEIIQKIQVDETSQNRLRGESVAAKSLRDLVIKYAIVDEPILLLGETGVGKSHVAEMIHTYSGRRGKFCVVNTPSIPSTLFESEIFGHKKGSFTDAKSDKKGIAQEADGGTLFFDEIAEIPQNFQAKFLRFIETCKYFVLGESHERQADVRIVSATNRNLRQAIAKNEFREDLYYRLQVLEIEIPPLRERKDDIPVLVKEKESLLKGKEIGPGFWEALQAYDWPGNIRELITVLTRAGIQAASPVTGEEMGKILNQARFRSTADDTTKMKNQKVQKIWEALKQGKSFWEVVKDPYLERELNRDEVKEVLAEALRLCNGKYIFTLEIFNVDPNDYKKFLNFINDNKLQP